MFPVTLDEQIAAARRELAMRRKVYPRQIEAKRLTQQSADHQIACMEAIVETLERVKSSSDRALETT